MKRSCCREDLVRRWLMKVAGGCETVSNLDVAHFHGTVCWRVCGAAPV